LTSVEIGPMRADELEAAAQCIASGEIFSRYGLTLESTAELLARTRGELVVARLRAETVGVAIYWTDGTMPAPAYLRLLAVRDGARGEGIGAALLRYVEEQVARCRPDLFLCCSTTNVGARRFYERHGYQAVGILTDLVVQGIDEVLYRKVLVEKKKLPKEPRGPSGSVLAGPGAPV
jgi:ribosomal protein S18 acetylase RimI-like enzyme